MFKKSLGMHTGNIFPISSLLKRKILIPTALEKNEKVKKSWSLIKTSMKSGLGFPAIYKDFISLLDDFSLVQVVSEPTRGENVLDFFLTSNHTLVETLRSHLVLLTTTSWSQM